MVEVVAVGEQGSLGEIPEMQEPETTSSALEVQNALPKASHIEITETEKPPKRKPGRPTKRTARAPNCERSSRKTELCSEGQTTPQAQAQTSFAERNAPRKLSAFGEWIHAGSVAFSRTVVR